MGKFGSFSREMKIEGVQRAGPFNVYTWELQDRHIFYRVDWEAKKRKKHEGYVKCTWEVEREA